QLRGAHQRQRAVVVRPLHPARAVGRRFLIERERALVVALPPALLRQLVVARQRRARAAGRNHEGRERAGGPLHALFRTSTASSAPRATSAALTSRWVTARTRRSPMALSKRPRSRARFTNAAASSGTSGARSQTTMLVATGTFPSRAPSRCSLRPCARATSAISKMLRCGKIRPPPRLCEFSTAASALTG